MLCFIFHLLFLFALEASCRAVPKQTSRDVRWERKWLAPRNWTLKLHIALRQEDGGDEVERRLLETSTPGHQSYRNYLEPEEIARLSMPHPGAVYAVENWLDQHSLAKVAALSGGIFQVEATVRQAERLLNTTYFVFSDGTKDVVRTDLFYLPDEIARHVDFVTPTNNFPAASRSSSIHGSIVRQAHARKSRQIALSDRDSCKAKGYGTPSCIRQAYKINHMAKPNRTTFGIYGTDAASRSPQDLQTYLERYNPKAAAARPSYQVVGHGDARECSGIAPRFETAMDTQTALGLAWPAQGILYNRGGILGPDPSTTYDHLVLFLQELLTNSTETLPSVISFSESTQESQMDPAFARRVCNMMAQVGLRGITLLFPSGNNGPNGNQPTGTPATSDCIVLCMARPMHN